jgi:hypothetical protein
MLVGSSGVRAEADSKDPGVPVAGNHKESTARRVSLANTGPTG